MLLLQYVRGSAAVSERLRVELKVWVSFCRGDRQNEKLVGFHVMAIDAVAVGVGAGAMESVAWCCARKGNVKI